MFDNEHSMENISLCAWLKWLNFLSCLVPHTMAHRICPMLYNQHFEHVFTTLLQMCYPQSVPPTVCELAFHKHLLMDFHFLLTTPLDLCTSHVRSHIKTLDDRYTDKFVPRNSTTIYPKFSHALFRTTFDRWNKMTYMLYIFLCIPLYLL